MKGLLSRHRYMTTGWVACALGVSGAYIIAHRPARTSLPYAEKEITVRVFKSKNRDLLDHISALNHGDAVRRLAASHPSAERDQALTHAVSQWADESPAEMMAWLDRFPKAELRNWLICAAVTAMSEHEPMEAGSFIEREMDEGQPRNHAIVAVAQRWAQHSPDHARQWVEHLGPTSATGDALLEIAVIEAEEEFNHQ